MQTTSRAETSQARPARQAAARRRGRRGLALALAATGLMSAVGLGAAGLLTSSTGCGGSTSSQSPDGGGTSMGGDMAGSGTADMGTGTDPEAQRPAQLDETSIDSWLQSGKYKKWRCETAPVGGRTVAHSRTSRVCSNSALYAAAATPYPTDSVSVLEIYNTAGQVSGYAVSVRTAQGDGGQNRYWYESSGGNVSAGQGLTVCTSCHFNAANDYTYLRAP